MRAALLKSAKRRLRARQWQPDQRPRQLTSPPDTGGMAHLRLMTHFLIVTRLSALSIKKICEPHSPKKICEPLPNITTQKSPKAWNRVSRLSGNILNY